MSDRRSRWLVGSGWTLAIAWGLLFATLAACGDDDPQAASAGRAMVAIARVDAALGGGSYGDGGVVTADAHVIDDGDGDVVRVDAHVIDDGDADLGDGGGGDGDGDVGDGGDGDAGDGGVDCGECDDGDACNGEETCDEETGECQPGTPVDCEDGDACDGVETCDPSGACEPGIPVICDDGDDCNGEETCDPDIGDCEEGTPMDCDDGDACNGEETCAMGPEACDDGSECDPDTGECEDGSTCDPWVAQCEPGTPVECDDGDLCNGEETCVSNPGECEDGSECDPDSGTCDDGSACPQVADCEPGTPVACDDGNACDGWETCNPYTGLCESGTPIDCDDGDLCNGTETCDPYTGACQPGVPVDCDDGDACNGIETCDPETGGCEAGTPGSCGCGPVPEHNVFRGLDTLTGAQAHFYRNVWDLVDAKCDTRSEPGTPGEEGAPDEPPCEIRLKGAFLNQIPGTSPQQYCWNDGVAGARYAPGPLGYQTSPPDGTLLVFDDSGAPAVVNHSQGWAVTFQDQFTGTVNTFTDQSGLTAWHRGQTRFVRENGTWNTSWVDNVSWLDDPSLDAWSPLQYGGHVTTDGNGTGSFTTSVNGLQFYVGGTTPGTLTLEQIPSAAGDISNGIMVSYLYSGTSVAETSYVDVATSTGLAFSWAQNTRDGEYIVDTAGAAPYAGGWNTAVMAPGALPPSAANGWADPAVALDGRYPEQAFGTMWTRNGRVELALDTDDMGNLDDVQEEGGRSWHATWDANRRMTGETTMEGGVLTEVTVSIWDPNNGELTYNSTSSLGNTHTFSSPFAPGSETPSSMQTIVNGSVLELDLPVYVTAATGFPVLATEAVTLNVDSFGGAVPQTANYVFSYPSATQVRIDENSRNIHLTYNDYPTGLLQTVTESTPWTSYTANVGYGAGGYISNFNDGTSVAGGGTIANSSYTSIGALGSSAGGSFSSGGVVVASGGDSVTWNGEALFEWNGDYSYFGVEADGTALVDPFSWGASTNVLGPGGLSETVGGSCSMGPSYTLVCTNGDSDDGDSWGGTCDESY